MNNANKNIQSPAKLMAIILIVGIVITVLSIFVSGIPFIFLICLMSTLILLFSLPMSLLVYRLSIRYECFSATLDFAGLIIIPLATSWWLVKTSFECANNQSCGLPITGLVVLLVVAGVAFNYYLFVKFRPKLSTIALSTMLFIWIIIAIVYFAPQILHIPNPWRFIG